MFISEFNGIENQVALTNYLDLLTDECVDSITNSPVCVSHTGRIVNLIYLDLKNSIKKGEFKKVMKENCLSGIIYWKNDTYPIPIEKLNSLLDLWLRICDKSSRDYLRMYDLIFAEAVYFQAQNSPIKIKVLKNISIKLSY